MYSFNRREMLRACGMGFAGVSLSGWMPPLAKLLADESAQRRHCILLWMPGGPSQTDTFDMKPGHANGGEFREIDTSIPGVRISQHLPKLAQQMEHIAIIRSLSTAEGDHARGTYLMHTGRKPGGPISFPTIGSALSKATGSEESELPNFISVAPYTAFNNDAFGPGFLGPKFAPLTVGATTAFQQVQPQQAANYADLSVDDLKNSDITRRQEDARLDLWNTLQTGFLTTHGSASPGAHATVYHRAVRMMHSAAAKAFDLSDEPAGLRDAYGRGRFGQGCLLARRLIERGVPMIEVALSGTGAGVLGWDTHAQNFTRVKSLSEELDAGWGTLLNDLHVRGLLESTTIIWLGEFGRTPQINRNGGRDHFPKAWTSVLAGGGIRGGQAFGNTSADGGDVEDHKVDVPDLFATLCRALNVDPNIHNISEVGRPIRIAEGKPITGVLT